MIIGAKKFIELKKLKDNLNVQNERMYMYNIKIFYF